MHKNRDVQNRLLAAWYATQSLEKLYEKYHRLRAQAEKVTPHYSLAPAKDGKQDTMAENVTMLADLERDYQKEFKEMRSTIKEVQIIIASLEDFRMRLILEDRYLNFIYEGKGLRKMKWEEIAIARHYSYQQVIKIHGSALEILKAQK